MQAQNKYYPPDWDPSKGSLNEYAGKHHLGERVKKLKTEGKLVIRFEMPFNVWCTSCKSHIALAVRFNAEKQRVGMYHSTPIWEFTMSCHRCGGTMVVRTNPREDTYEMIRGIQRREDGRQPQYLPDDVDGDGGSVAAAVAGGAPDTSAAAHRERMGSDPMYRVEQAGKDAREAMVREPDLADLIELEGRRAESAEATAERARAAMRVRRAAAGAAERRLPSLTAAEEARAVAVMATARALLGAGKGVGGGSGTGSGTRVVSEDAVARAAEARILAQSPFAVAGGSAVPRAAGSEAETQTGAATAAAAVSAGGRVVVAARRKERPQQQGPHVNSEQKGPTGSAAAAAAPPTAALVAIGVKRGRDEGSGHPSPARAVPPAGGGLQGLVGYGSDSGSEDDEGTPASGSVNAAPSAAHGDVASSGSFVATGGAAPRSEVR